MSEIDAKTRADLLAIIDDRAASKATTITSQLPIEHWHAWVGDATIADAILDRITHRNHRFTLACDSVRQKPKASRKEPKKTRRDRRTDNLTAQRQTAANRSRSPERSFTVTGIRSHKLRPFRLPF
jgi:hypothetical protein